MNAEQILRLEDKLDKVITELSAVARELSANTEQSRTLFRLVEELQEKVHDTELRLRKIEANCSEKIGLYLTVDEIKKAQKEHADNIDTLKSNEDKRTGALAVIGIVCAFIGSMIGIFVKHLLDGK